MTIKKDIPLEKDIQKEICEWLEYNGHFFWRQNNIPVFGKSMDGQFRHRAMPKYSKKGIPDIIVLFRGKFIGLEVKREPHLPLSDDQQKFKEGLENVGGVYYKVSSVADLFSINEFI